MTDQLKPGAPAHGNYEHEDLAPRAILIFLLVLGAATILCIVALRGVYSFLDARERSGQKSMSPLITAVPEDTRHVPAGYPQATFPNPKLEEDERGQLNGIRNDWNQSLYSYGWVNQQAGTVRIPIDRAMDLLVQRGLPVHPQAPSESGNTTTEKTQTRNPGIGKAEAAKQVSGEKTPQ